MKDFSPGEESLVVASDLMKSARKIIKRKLRKRNGILGRQAPAKVLDAIKGLSGEQVAIALIKHEAALYPDTSRCRDIIQVLTNLSIINHKEKIAEGERLAELDMHTESSVDPVRASEPTLPTTFPNHTRLNLGENPSIEDISKLVKSPPPGMQVVEFLIKGAWAGHILVPDGKEKDTTFLQDHLTNMMPTAVPYVYDYFGNPVAEIWPGYSIPGFSYEHDGVVLVDFQHDPQTRSYRVRHVDEVSPEAG